MPHRRSIAAVKCAQRARDFDDLFRQQFILSRDPEDLPPDWPRRSLEGWHLACGDALEVRDLRDADGTHVGFLLGIAIGPEGLQTGGSAELPGRAGAPDFPERVRDFVTGLGGRFLVVLLAGELRRVFGDPTHSYPWVYDPERRTCASTVSLIARYPLEPNPRYEPKRLIRGQIVPNFGDTTDRRVRRALPNHYLDLSDFGMRRFAPGLVKTIEAPDAIATACTRIAEKLRFLLRELVTRHPCVLPVTGGHDSRVLVACASPFLGEVRELSSYRFHNASRVDSRMARDLLNDLGHEHTTYFKEARTVGQYRDQRLKSGWAPVRQELEALAMLEKYPRDHLVLRGALIEMTRANQWRHDRIGKPTRVSYGLRRLRLGGPTSRPDKTDWDALYRGWMGALPEGADQRVYDLAHIELWLPNSLGAYYAGFHRNFFVDPFNDRELISLSLGLPPERRKSVDMVRDIITAANPEIPTDYFH